MVRERGNCERGTEVTWSSNAKSARTSWPRQVGEFAFRHPAGPAYYENLLEATERDRSHRVDAGGEWLLVGLGRVKIFQHPHPFRSSSKVSQDSVGPSISR